MSLYDILQPAHATGQFVLVALGSLVAIWLVTLLAAVRTTVLERRCLHSIDRLVDASGNAVQRDAIRARWGGRVVIRPLVQMLGLTRMEAEAASQRVAVAAERQLLGRLPFLQALLNLFVVVGLLGTLFGLAESLSSLRAEDREQFGRLLTGLRSAFAPSIWGVSAFIVCGVLLAVYRVALLEPLLVDLRSKIDKWVNALTIPIEAEVVNAAQSTINAAKDVVRFAADIRDDSAKLQGVVGETVESFRSLQKASKAIEQSLERWATAVAGGAKELALASTNLTEGIKASQRLWIEAEQRRTDVQAMLERALDTNGRVESTIAAWKESASGHQTRMETTLRDQSVTLTKVATDIGSAARQLEASAAGVADRAARLVKEELSGRASALDKTLGILDNHVSTLRKPFEDAANRLVNVGNQLVPAGNRLEGQAVRLAEIADRRSRAGTPGGSDMTQVEGLLEQLLMELRRNPVRRLFRFWR